MAGLELPADSNQDPNLIVTIHNYEPFHFTHQGAGWVEGGSDWLGTGWDGTPDEVAAVQGAWTAPRLGARRTIAPCLWASSARIRRRI